MSPVYIQGVEQVVIHAPKHQDTGVDEISVAALSGVLADDQHVLDAEVTAVAIPLAQKAAASGVASLDASSLVVQDPVNAVATATANKIVKRDASARAAFAAPNAAGDALIKGTALTITEMAALTTGKIWQGVANRPSEVDLPAGKSIASGSYTGNGAGPRQITVGFQCSFVVLFNCTTMNTGTHWFMIPNTVRNAAFAADVVAYIHLHATDGFTVQDGGGAATFGNTNTETYRYWAISV